MGGEDELVGSTGRGDARSRRRDWWSTGTVEDGVAGAGRDRVDAGRGRREGRSGEGATWRP